MSRWQSESGSSTTELVLLMPVVLTLVLLVVQFGLWMHGRHVASAAAQEGLAAAQVEAGTDELARARALQFATDAGGLTDVSVVAVRNDTAARVEVRATVPSTLPGWSSFAVSAIVEGPVEVFVSEVDR